MEEKIITENKKIEAKLEQLEGLRKDFVDKNLFDNLLSKMIEIFTKRFNFMKELEKCLGTSDEKIAEKKLNEIIQENTKLLEKWEKFFIENKFKYKTK